MDGDDEDARSLETVDIAKSNDVSPVKFTNQGSLMQEDAEEMATVMQSN